MRADPIRSTRLRAYPRGMNDALAWLGVAGGIAGGAAALYTATRARSIERYRAQLKAEGYEHEVRFARLHERRVEIIAEIYRKLVRAERAFGSWVSLLQEAGEPTMDEKGSLAADAFSDFRTFFLENRIWLDQDLCDRIALMDRELFTSFIDFTTYRRNDPNVHDDYMEKVDVHLEEDAGTHPRLTDGDRRSLP
jgi:hypothetical protein